MKNEELKFGKCSRGAKLQMLTERLSVLDYMLSQPQKYHTILGFLRQQAEIVSAYIDDLLNGRLIPFEEDKDSTVSE